MNYCLNYDGAISVIDTDKYQSTGQLVFFDKYVFMVVNQIVRFINRKIRLSEIDIRTLLGFSN